MQPVMSAAPEASPALVFETLNAHQRTAALRTAIEIDLFRAVGEGPADAPTLAQRCGASERGVRILCDFLTVLGFLIKEDGSYRHSPTSSRPSVAGESRFHREVRRQSRSSRSALA